MDKTDNLTSSDGRRNNRNATNLNDHYLTKFKENNSEFNISYAWKGSLSSLMSCENLTEDLVAEAMKDLEKALNESQMLLNDRDRQIEKLRQAIEESQISMKNDTTKQENLLHEVEISHKRILDLENELQALKRHEMENERMANMNLKAKDQDQSKKQIECTCYCGSACMALQELSIVKEKLEKTEHKYANLKRKIREKRKVEANSSSHKYPQKILVAEKSASCILQ